MNQALAMLVEVEPVRTGNDVSLTAGILWGLFWLALFTMSILAYFGRNILASIEARSERRHNRVMLHGYRLSLTRGGLVCLRGISRCADWRLQ